MKKNLVIVALLAIVVWLSLQVIRLERIQAEAASRLGLIQALGPE
ncbi:hypothetical protein [Lysobacter sp. P5_B9]